MVAAWRVRPPAKVKSNNSQALQHTPIKKVSVEDVEIKASLWLIYFFFQLYLLYSYIFV